MTNVLYNVKWLVFSRNVCKELPIVEEIDKGLLLKNLTDKVYTAPDIEDQQALSLFYMTNGKGVFISVADKTTKEIDHRFAYPVDSVVILTSIEDDVSYTVRYHFDKLLAEQHWQPCSTEELLSSYRK